MNNEDFKSLIKTAPEMEFTPSEDFTENIMLRVNEVAQTKRQVEPIISVKVFWIIGFLFSGIALLPFFVELSGAAPFYFENLQIGFIDLETARENIQIMMQLLFAVGTIVLCDVLLKLRTVNY